MRILRITRMGSAISTRRSVGRDVGQMRVVPVRYRRRSEDTRLGSKVKKFTEYTLIARKKWVSPEKVESWGIGE